MQMFQKLISGSPRVLNDKVWKSCSTFERFWGLSTFCLFQNITLIVFQHYTWFWGRLHTNEPARPVSYEMYLQVNHLTMPSNALQEPLLNTVSTLNWNYSRAHLSPQTWGLMRAEHLLLLPTQILLECLVHSWYLLNIHSMTHLTMYWLFYFWMSKTLTRKCFYKKACVIDTG